MATTPPAPEENLPTEGDTARREVIAARLNAGGPVTAEHAIELAQALLEIAALAMPDTYFAADPRCQLARAVLSRAGRITTGDAR